MKLRILTSTAIFATFAFLLSTPLCHAEAQPPVKTLNLTEPQERATVAGTVKRGEHDYYMFEISVSQTLTVGISSTDNNAAFAIYDPGAKFETAGNQVSLEGAMEKSASEGDGTIKWAGKLLKPGTYYIAVSSAHETAAYYMTVSLRP